MAKSLKIITSICMCVFISIAFFACSSNASDEKSTSEGAFTIYVVKDTPINSLIKKYNENKANEKRLEIVEFENNTELGSKLNAEIMAGKGPDLIYFDSGFGGISNIEKMMSLDMFADYNELLGNDNSDNKINLDNYDKTVMDAGTYNGKRYFMPISYMPDILITTAEACDKYKINLNDSITYENAENMLSECLSKGNESKDISVFYYINEELYALIDSNINFFSRTDTLKSDDFLNNIDVLNGLILPADQNDISNILDPLDSILKGNTIFASLYQIAGSEPNALGYIYYYLKSNKQTPLIMNNLSDSKNTFSAYIDKGFLINNNSNKKEEAFEFVKYMLSEKIQCNPEIGLPVNKNARSTLIEEMAETDAKSFGVDYDKDTVDAQYINSYVSFLDGINNCSFKNNYFNQSVIGDSVSKYINGEIKKEQLVKEIQDKAKIYLEE